MEEKYPINDPVTGKPFNGQTTYQNQGTMSTSSNGNDKGGRDLFIAALACWIIGNLLLFTEVAIVAGFLLIPGFIIAIIAMEKYPGSKFAKLLTALFIIEIIIVIVGILYVIHTCMSCLNGGCAEMG